MLSARQRETAGFGGRPERMSVVSGPVGSGKTHAALVGWLLWMSRHENHEFGLLTKSRAQMTSVLKGGLSRILGQELTADSEGLVKVPNYYGGTNDLWTFVAQDRRAEPRVRSYNLTGFLIDEATTLPFEIIAAANARCRVGDSKIVLLTNPDGPLHPLKRKYIDHAAEVSAHVVMTELRDNPTLTEAYIESLKANYDGHMLERMVNGRWAAAAGLVYPRFGEFVRDVIPEDTHFVAHDVVIDVGESSITHALLSGRTDRGATWILDEYRYNHTLKGVIPERQLVADVRRAFAHVGIHSWIVDPAALRFRQELLAQMPHAHVGKAENAWEEGYQEVNHWLSLEALYFYEPKLPHLVDELGGLVWDEEKAQLGTDEPIKTSDHGTDALRYLILTRAVQEAGGREAWQNLRTQQRETPR